MHLNASDLPIVLQEATRASSRLRRRLGLSACDAEDLNQELLVRLFRRLRSFEPERGSLGAFVGHVLENEARPPRRTHPARAPSLRRWAAVARCSGKGRHDARRSAKRRPRRWGEHTNARERAEERIDVAAVMDRLDRCNRLLLVALVHFSVDELANRGFGSRAGLYRRLRDLRFRLTAYGLRAA
jgi:DNA-directed RNA polymerase specialized sigma24 family protein